MREEEKYGREGGEYRGRGREKEMMEKEGEIGQEHETVRG